MRHFIRFVDLLVLTLGLLLIFCSYLGCRQQRNDDTLSTPAHCLSPLILLVLLKLSLPYREVHLVYQFR